MNRCPICRYKLEVKDYTSSEMSERYEKCVDGCKQYGFEELCGNFRTKLGNTEIYEHWNQTNKSFMRGMFIRKRVISRLRKKYRKQVGK